MAKKSEMVVRELLEIAGVHISIESIMSNIWAKKCP